MENYKKYGLTLIDQLSINYIKILKPTYKEKNRKIWTGIRCGTINRVGKLNKCWFCKEEYEALTHRITCEYIKQTFGYE